MFASESRYFAPVEIVRCTAPITHFPPPGRGIQSPDRMPEIIRIETDYSSPVAEAVIEPCTTSERVESFTDWIHVFEGPTDLADTNNTTPSM